MSFIGNKKDSKLKVVEESKKQISEQDEDSFTDSEYRKEVEKDLKEMNANSAMDDSFSESFYKEILNDSEDEEEQISNQKKIVKKETTAEEANSKFIFCL